MRRQSSFKDRWKGSTKSLAGFLKVGPSSLSRQESFTSLAKEEEGLDDDKPRKSNLRRNLSRKMRDIVARSVSYPLTPRGELARAQSLSSLSISGTSVQVLPGETVSNRKVQRKDLPVCWLDQGQVKARQKSDKERSMQMDIITRLQVRPFTRHLARHILTFMREEDMSTMSKVSRNWRVFLLRELKPGVFSRIRNLEIIEVKKVIDL
eukprot:GFUD01077060.1.p1 GENE.GFUD01077060.1~~GFUD01077060.1.p1  ORF type:complete len:208 (+),score=70.62 GFUD01077060.1:30-653(+)